MDVYVTLCACVNMFLKIRNFITLQRLACFKDASNTSSVWVKFDYSSIIIAWPSIGIEHNTNKPGKLKLK